MKLRKIRAGSYELDAGRGIYVRIRKERISTIGYFWTAVAYHLNEYLGRIGHRFPTMGSAKQASIRYLESR